MNAFDYKCNKCGSMLHGFFCPDCDEEHGVDLSAGVKFDAGKPKWHLLPYDAIREVVLVFTKGAEKYEERNWEKGMAWSRVFNSTQRHLTDWFQKRETFDPDGTGLRNIAQATWGCLVLLAWELRGHGTDDRPQVGG